MRSLLDVNVLIALLDVDHQQHALAQDWFAVAAANGWSTCPITQNGCIRIMSQPSYSNPFAPAEIAQRLFEATATPEHEFWPDAMSLLDNGRIDWAALVGPRQLTDTYLLALAVDRGGRFATFDRRITPATVAGATEVHLARI